MREVGYLSREGQISTIASNHNEEEFKIDFVKTTQKLIAFSSLMEKQKKEKKKFFSHCDEYFSNNFLRGQIRKETRNIAFLL